MAYTSDKKPGALVAATILDGNNNVVVEQSGDVKRATLSQVEAKVFDAKTAITGPAGPAGTEVVVVRQTDNNLRQVALADIVPAGNIVDAKISASAAIADTKLATINTAGKVTNNAVQAVSTNTANRIVTRDGSGNFAAGTITATLAGSITGNAPTATILATGRTVALTGDVTGTTGAFNGSANVSAATTIANNAVTTAKIADANVTTAKIADANVTNVKIASGVDAAKLTTGTIPAARIGNDAIDAAKIASNAVTDVKIASGVDAAKLTTGTLPIARIADGAVTNAKLATGIDAAKLTTGTLPDARIGSNAITNARIADGAVTNAKLSLNANDGEIKKALNANNNPPIFGCRAWVNFNGVRNTSFAPPSDGDFIMIRASGNVSSVQKIAKGTYSVNFAIPMPDKNYVAVVTGQRGNAVSVGTSNLRGETGNTFQSLTTNSAIVMTGDGNGSPLDFPIVCVAIFR